MTNLLVSKKTFHFPEVRIVEASAGSGKTYALAKRYIQLLLNPSLHLEKIPIRNILAITFTNKAAFEMKERILEFLKTIALGKLSKAQEQDILEPLGIDRGQASTKAFAIMEALIHNYNFFQVQTIDKFINALLSGCAFKIGLTANFKIKTNSSEYLEYSLDELIDNAHQDKSTMKIFEQFLHNYLYLENRSGWFPKDDMIAIMCALFMQNNAYGTAFKQGPFTSEDIIKKKNKILSAITTLRTGIPEVTDKRFVKSLDAFLEKNLKGFDIDGISDYFARDHVPVRRKVEVPAKVEQLWSKIRRDLRQLCEEEASSLFNPYIQIFEEVRHTFLELSAKDDCLFLEELNKRAQGLFDENYITVEELYYRLATRVQHYLIDEFQDTSRLQWHNLEKMAEEALSTGGSLFYVGDRKQAIYGFRGGDVGLFEDIKEEFNAFNVQTDLLTNNWRSQKAIVEFNNAVFAIDNLKRFITQKETYELEKNKRNAVLFGDQDFQELGRLFSSQQSFQPQKNDGYVKVEYIDIEKKEEREEVLRDKVIDLIKELRTRFSYRDIAILTRSNQQIEQMTSWLLEEGILVESERTSDITKNNLIEELIAFLHFLNSPIDNEAFTSFILGAIFAKATGLKTEELHNFVFNLREPLSREKDLYVYTEFREKYPAQWAQFIDEFFKNVGLYPLYELVVSIYNTFDVLRHFAEFQGFLMHFLELVKKEEEERTDITSFLEYFEGIQGDDLYVNVTDSDAIKILTVHKAKGLEFPVVVLPFLGMHIQVGSRGDDYQQSYILQKSNAFIELVRLKNKYLSFSEHLYRLHSQEYKKSFLTELNSIYVALTRPQNELYAFIPKRTGNSFNVARFLIPEDIYEQGAPIKYEPTKPKGEDFFKLPCSQYHDWIDYLKDEFHGLDEVKNREQRFKGEVTHFMLSMIGNLNLESKEEALQYALREAELHYPQIEDFSDYSVLIEQLWKARDMKPFFCIEDGEVFTEKDVVNSAGHTKRLDRLIVKKDEVWIIDYKSGRDPQGQYEKQVQEYMDIVQGLYPKARLRGFLVYLDCLEVEEVITADSV